MRKISLLLLALVLLCALGVSCKSTTTYYGMTQMLPEFSVTWEDLDKDQYEFIGNVTGSSTFTIESDDSTSYELTGVLNINNLDGIPNDSEVRAALDTAVYEMTLKAKELNANFLIMPSYSVEAKEQTIMSGLFRPTFVTEVTVSVSAVAVRLIDSNGQSLEVY